MRKISVLFVMLAGLANLSAAAHSATASAMDKFQKIGTFHAVGGVKGVAVGPGAVPGSQRLYIDYMYIGDTIEIVSVDPASGEYQTFPNPVPGESGSYGLILGPDGNMYMGSLPNAHLYCLNTKTQKLEDVGMPCPGEQYIWDLTVAPDKKLYGCTYPGCKIFSYDPATKKMQDLGRIDAREQYARFIAAGDDGFLYISTGTVHAGIVAYNIATGSFHQILSEADRGPLFYTIFRGSDGKIYATGLGHAFRLENGQASKLAGKAPQAQSTVLLTDGSTVTINGKAPEPQSIEISHEGKIVASHPYLYLGRPLNIFRFTATPEGIIYGSSILPLYFFSLNPSTGNFTNFGHWGGGETYSLLAHQGKVLLASYAANSVLMSYDPAQPAKNGGNPLYVSYEGADHAWRPAAMITGKDNKVYVGATAGYGALGGPLAVWDTAIQKVSAFDNLIPGQSIASLAASPDGAIYGGTSISGGGGAVPTQKDAVLFRFDPTTHKVTSQIVPVRGASSINDLIMTPAGKLLGFAGHTVFVYDPATQQVIHRQEVEMGALIYNSVVIGPGPQIYGLSSEGIFSINPVTYAVQLIAKAPGQITGGGALIGNQFYFASLGTVYQYTIPAK